MTRTILKTGPLELVGCTADLLRAEGEDRAAFARLLEARVPAAWPPELYDDDARRWTLERVEAAPDSQGWWTYYLLCAGDGEEREAVGVAGYKGPPAEDGTVEIGYSVLAGHRRRGYAAAAAAALVERAFADPRVTRVVAETLSELAPSIGVLEKCGFVLSGEGLEEGVIRFELPRERWGAR